MPIVVNLDVMMARRHKGAGELVDRIIQPGDILAEMQPSDNF